MGELAPLLKELTPLFGSGGAIVLSVWWLLWRNKAGDADKAQQLMAATHWQKIAQNAEDRRVVAEQRADQFAHERNEAYQQVWELKGQLRQVLEQLEALKQELQSMKERYDANNKH